MRRHHTVILLLSVMACSAQDTGNWQRLAQLQPGDQVRLSWKAHGHVTGPFQTWTPEQVTVGSTAAKREDVAKLERYRKGV